MKLRVRLVTRRLLLAGAALPLIGGASYAQDKDTSSVAGPVEVTITATRKKAALSKVPISVTAFTQDNLDAKGVRNIDDISRLAPGVRLVSLGGNDIAGDGKSISIRGISSSVGSATTGIYLDDTPIQVRRVGNATTNFYPTIFDLERVEVLRGPQGTLFGAGAEGGTVRFITPQPSLTNYSTYVRTELGFTDGGDPSYEAGIATGGPIIEDKLGFRISTYYRRDGGYIDRVDPSSMKQVEDNANSQDNFASRAALTWKMTPEFKGTFSVYTQTEKSNGSSFYFEDLSDSQNGKFLSGTSQPSTSKGNLILPSLNLEYDGNSFDIISTSSYLNRKTERYVDYTNYISTLFFGTPYGYESGETSSAKLNDSQHDFTQEVRFQSNTNGRFNWVVGGFYSQSKQYSYQVNIDTDVDAALLRTYGIDTEGFLGQALYDGYSLFVTSASTTDQQTALFGQVDYEIFDGLKLTAGLRAAKVDLQAARVSVGPVAGSGVSFDTKQSESPTMPKVGVSWQIDNNNLYYATAAKGYRIGGINGPQNAFCASSLAELGLNNSPETYQSDSVWSYEAGAKNKVLDGKLSLETSVFNVKWDNIQTGVSLSNCGSGFITNLGKAESTGFDFAFNLKATGRLNLSGSVGYADAHNTEKVTGATNSSGVTTVYANNGTKIGGPPWSWALSGDYVFVLMSQDAYARFDYQHTGEGAKLDYGVSNTDVSLYPTKAWDVVNLRTGIRRNGIDASIYINNLFNKSPVIYRRRDSTSSSLYFDSTIRPFTMGVTLSYRY